MQITSLKVIATKIARDFTLPAPILLAMIEVESGGNEWASRYERKYRWCVDARTRKPWTATRQQALMSCAPAGFPAPDPKISGYYSTADTEWIQQKTSWGVMQVIGAVARELGWNKPLPLLCEPLHGIEYGCHHLARLRDRHYKKHGWAGVLDAYNDGTARIERPDDYPYRVAAASPAAAQMITLP